MKNRTFALLVLIALFLFSINGIKAQENQTIIVGKVYTQNNLESGGVSGATVTVTCNGYTETTTSLSDGTYAVGFPYVECSENSKISIAASCPDKSQCAYDNSSVNMNLETTATITVSGGSNNNAVYGGKIQYCGDGICQPGETAQTCPQDCVAKVQVKTENTTITNIQKTTTSNPGFFSAMTGAVVGVFSAPGGVLLGMFIVLIIGGTIVVLFNNIKK